MLKSLKQRAAILAAFVAVLSLVVVPAAGAVPTNDDLDDALLITDGYVAGTDLTGATLEGSEVDGSCEYLAPDWSIWYRFTAPATGKVWLQTRLTPSPNTMNFITVFELTTVGPPHVLGTEVACSLGQNVNNEEVAVTNGTEYAVRVSGAASDDTDTVTLEFETMGTLTGTVTEEGTGNPLEDISVEVLDAVSGSKLLASATTLVDGTWQADAPTQSAIVRFVDSTNAVYGTLYYDQAVLKVDATTVDILAGTTHSNIDAVLGTAGTLSGTITSSLGSALLEGATVAIYDYPTPGPPVKQGHTNASGEYALTGLPPGDYFVHFNHADHFDEWHDNVDHWSNGGTAVTISAGVTTVLDAELSAGGQISGVVTDDLGQPIEGVTIEVFSAPNTVARQKITGTDGSYEISAIEAGVYAVRANSDTAVEGGYGREWWDNHPVGTPFSTIDKITVSAGSADVASFSLERSQISGTVTSADDALPIEGVVVTLSNDLAAQVAQTTTDANGDFSFDTFAFTDPPLSLSFEATSLFFVDGSPPPFAFAGGDNLLGSIALDVDQQAPNITNTTLAFNVSENDAVGTPIVDLTATDSNRADTTTWSITAGNTGGAFTIDPSTGAIETAASLDFETTPSYTLTVVASDGSLEDTVSVTVDINDIAETIPKAGFIDTVGHIFESNIDWLAYMGVTKGCNPPDNTMFCPDDHVTRGQMAAFLVRALGLTDTLDNPFTDDDTSIFQSDIERLAAAGVTKGCNPPTNDLFCPDAKVTREQMAAFLVRALGYVDDGGGDLFLDDNLSVFEADIDRLATAGVTKGCNPPANDLFCPSSFVTRGQMAAFLFRALG